MKIVVVLFLMLVAIVSSASASEFQETSLDGIGTFYTKTITPALTPTSDFAGRGDEDEYALYLQQAYYLKNAMYDEYVALHIDTDQAENNAVNFRKDPENKWVNKILSKVESSGAVAVLKSDDYSMLITRSDTGSYGMTAFFNDNDALKIIAIPYYYKDKMPNLMSAYQALTTGEWKL